MIKRIKRRLNKMKNRGSSFILVIVSTTFLCILVSALLMGVLLAYKIKFYKLNSLNNFYSVEQAMDQIYAGIGASTNEHLYTAYSTTAEFVVTYDTDNGQYTNMTNDEANELFKKLFMQGMTSDANFKSITQFRDALNDFVTVDGVTVDVSNMSVVFIDENGHTSTQYFSHYVDASGNEVVQPKLAQDSTYNDNKVKSIEFRNICVKRSIDLSGTSTSALASGTYVQSITTDLVLSEPEYNVQFSMSGASSDSLYNYALLADMGLQVNESTDGTDVAINGNIYTAADYYNKDYDSDSSTMVTKKFNSKTGDFTWGSTNQSAYSGIYVTGANSTLTMKSDVIVCSGTVAAFDGAAINLTGRSTLLSELWTDNIVIGGDEGGSMNISANAYVYDDTELNAKNSSLTFNSGTYFGYSYTSDDVRSVDFLKSKVGYLVSDFSMRSHFSDSAIIVNGTGSNLNLSNLSSLYIAGKSYIEFSKVAAGSVTSDSGLTLDDNADFALSTVKDYSTGQSLDVKSNQLIFLTQWELDSSISETVDEDGYTHVVLKFPSTYANDPTRLGKNGGIYSEFLARLQTLYGENRVEAIKQTVSGHDYYYLYIESGDSDGDGIDDAEEFAEKYYDLLLGPAGEDMSGQIYNVVNYEDFDVKLYLPSDNSKINAAGAVTDQTTSKVNGESVSTLFYRSSADTTMDVEAALKSAASSKTFTLLLGNKGTTENNLVYEDLKASSAKLASDSTATKEQKISNFLSYMYINMKDHLAVTDAVDDDDNAVSAWALAGYTNGLSGYTYTYDKDNDTYSYNYSLTPLNNYVDYAYVLTHDTVIKTVGAGDKESIVVVTPNSIQLSASAADGSLQGIVVAGGDVTFDSSVKSFKGLIISGGKVICSSDIKISADATYVASLMDTCAEDTDEDVSLITRVLKNYSNESEATGATVDGVSITDISYEDILLFQNWKKNVE
jgi:hypothetical protein